MNDDASEDVNAAPTSGVFFLVIVRKNFSDFFRVPGPRSFGGQLGEQHTNRFYRTEHPIRR
jgi:hypothetical protein